MGLAYGVVMESHEALYAEALAPVMLSEETLHSASADLGGLDSVDTVC